MSRHLCQSHHFTEMQNNIRFLFLDFSTRPAERNLQELCLNFFTIFPLEVSAKQDSHAA